MISSIRIACSFNCSPCFFFSLSNVAIRSFWLSTFIPKFSSPTRLVSNTFPCFSCSSFCSSSLPSILVILLPFPAISAWIPFTVSLLLFEYSSTASNPVSIFVNRFPCSSTLTSVFPIFTSLAFIPFLFSATSNFVVATFSLFVSTSLANVTCFSFCSFICFAFSTTSNFVSAMESLFTSTPLDSSSCFAFWSTITLFNWLSNASINPDCVFPNSSFWLICSSKSINTCCTVLLSLFLNASYTPTRFANALSLFDPWLLISSSVMNFSSFNSLICAFAIIKSLPCSSNWLFTTASSSCNLLIFVSCSLICFACPSLSSLLLSSPFFVVS